MFEAIIRDTAGRFGIGDKAKPLLAAVLGLLFDERAGGFAGLLTRFREHGLGSLFESWIGAREPAPIEPQQLDQILGTPTATALATQLGLSRSTTLAAAAAMLPRLVAALSPGGQLPARLPAGALAADGGALAETESLTPGLGWIKWVLLAAILITLAWSVIVQRAAVPRGTSPAAAAAAAGSAASDPPARSDGAGEPTSAATRAFRALQPGHYDAGALVAALNLMTIHFGTGSAAIDRDSLDILAEAAVALKNAPAGTRVEIDGHTDDVGNAAANLALSEQRAAAVRSKLIELGVPADLLSAKGYGDTQPVAGNGDDAGRARNRRMAFRVVS